MRKKIKLSELFISIGIGVAIMAIVVVLFTVLSGEPEEISLAEDNQQEETTPEPTPEVTPIPGSLPAITADIGDIIRFGAYDWLVLDIQNNHAMLITENVISRRWYHHTWDYVTWETSEIREYLNSTFFNTFGAADRARILETTVINTGNPWLGASGGNNTTDRIFLLSIEEVVRYFGDSGQLANRHGTALDIIDEYDEARIAHYLSGPAWWWVRSPGRSNDIAAFVSFYGYINMYGTVVYWPDINGGGVRPALWINLNP